jgi:hypothetical protein
MEMGYLMMQSKASAHACTIYAGTQQGRAIHNLRAKDQVPYHDACTFPFLVLSFIIPWPLWLSTLCLPNTPFHTTAAAYMPFSSSSSSSLSLATSGIQPFPGFKLFWVLLFMSMATFACAFHGR